MQLDALIGDVIFGARILRRQRAYTAACTLTLAMGIGATTAVFAVIDATLFRPLPYKDPHRLVGLASLLTDPDGRRSPYSLSQIELVRWQAAANGFDAIEALEPRTITLTGQGDPEVLRGAAVSQGLFSMLGAQPSRGRIFTAGEERLDAPRAVISDLLWRRRFNADPAVISRTVDLDGRPFEVVGVMPAGFAPLLDRSEIWVPLHATVNPARQSLRIMTSAGRLRPGVTAAHAQQELAAISEALAREFPASHTGMTPQVRDLQEQLLGDRRPALLTLAASVLLLLLLACANVLNLTLGHLTTRRSELAVRAAIGSGRWPLVRLQLVQTVLLASLGGAVGVALMAWSLPALLAVYTRAGQTPVDVAFDWRVLSFATLTVGGTALASGMWPALRAQRASVEGALTHVSSGRVGGGPWERRVRGTLVIAQVALAVTLLCGAGAFLISLQRLLATAPGFSADGVLSLQLMLAPTRYRDAAARASFVRQLLDRVSTLPGVVAAGTTQTTFQPNESMQTSLWIDGRPIDPEHTESAHIRHITPGYFQALHVPVVEGRAIDARDQMGETAVCMISARFAQRFWPRERAIGHRVRRISENAPWLTIVGVAADVMDAGLGVQQGPTIYLPYLQQNTATARVTLLVRAAGDPIAMANAVRQAIWAIDPLQPVDHVERLRDLLVDSTGDQQFRTLLLSAFAVVGLALALVGIYGVTAAAIKARTWETGVRLALGATRARVIAGMVGETSGQLLSGIFAGVALFLGAGRLAAGLLYNTSPMDPRVMAIAIAPLAIVSMLVSYVQARQLANVSPVAALRDSSAC
jgi:putative ABC transport system permease protein